MTVTNLFRISEYFEESKLEFWSYLLYLVLCFQCYVEMRDYEEAVRWLEMGKKTPVVSQDVSTILLAGKLLSFILVLLKPDSSFLKTL